MIKNQLRFEAALSGRGESDSEELDDGSHNKDDTYTGVPPRP